MLVPGKPDPLSDEALTGDELVLAQLTTTSATSPTNSGLPAARMRGMDGRHLTNVV